MSDLPTTISSARKVSKELQVAFSTAVCVLMCSQTAIAGTPFDIGDVFVGVAKGRVQHRKATGELVQTLNTTRGGSTTGMAFDAIGNLYVTNFNARSVSKFDGTGDLLGTFGSGYSGYPESILFDGFGNVYVGAVDGDNDVRKFDPLGTPIDQYNVATEDRGSDWIDLAADQCTLFYTSEDKNIKRYDVCTKTQRSNFNAARLPGTHAYAFRILLDGGVLVADSSAIVRLNWAGNIVQTYDAAGENCWFALNLDPDGTSFWSADFCSSNVYRFDIETGEQLSSFNTGTAGGTVFGLVVFGEVTVSAPVGLRARVGNQTVFLDWDPPAEAVDQYEILLEREVNGVFETAGHGTVNIAPRRDECEFFPDSCYYNLWPGLTNGELYRFTVTAVVGDARSVPAGPVLARPGEFAISDLPSRPKQPVLFIHGICLEEAHPTTADTWDITTAFLSDTLHWRSGGTLFYGEDGDPRTTSPGTTDFHSDGDYFGITFGHCQATYPTGRRGLLHQADEVHGVIQHLDQAGRQKVAIVAHSMGGISSRAYMVDYAEDATQHVTDFITYGTPHWGVRVAGLYGAVADSDGARDMDVDCVDSHLDYADNEFMENLRNEPLPPGIRYFSLRGHSHDNPFPVPAHAGPLIVGDCLSSHWDGLVSLDSADFGAIPSAAPSGQQALTNEDVGLLTTGRTHTRQTSDFSGILCALNPGCFVATVRSPVYMEVTGPDGRTLARQLTEIPGASYVELPDENDHQIAEAIVPFPQNGTYHIRVIPKAGVFSTDTYTLEVRQNGKTVVLAQDQQVQDIPKDPFVFVVEGKAALTGDFNHDGCVDRSDYDLLMGDVRDGDPNNPEYDLNADGAVNRADARTLVGLFTNPRGATCE